MLDAGLTLVRPGGGGTHVRTQAVHTKKGIKYGIFVI